MTAPRRVRTQAERAADGTTWRHTANGSAEAEQVIADVLAAWEQHIVPLDPNRPELHWRDITGLPEPRRRWWHRLTRRNP